MRQNWTDSRMDDLKHQVDRLDAKVDDGFARLDAKMDDGFARLDAKMDDGFARLDAKIDRTTEAQAGRIDALAGRFDALNQTILTATGRLFAACIAVVVAILGLIATQL